MFCVAVPFVCFCSLSNELEFSIGTLPLRDLLSNSVILLLRLHLIPPSLTTWYTLQFFPSPTSLFGYLCVYDY